ncbi:MAG TPA: glycosyltransferase family 2 protein [Cyclobacteriaceae bacterium]|jgi:glycosyltransferase involved in cell wall biosynthesis|nr:glycosyltransferase family 2 protein [Cyclobacteriaceae bacterium]
MSVSICMATHNGAGFVGEQIKSIINQLKENDELVITDDASTDGTVDVIRDFNDPRIRLLTSKTFNDPVKNFEYGLKNCRHDVIFLADQDDVWHQEKISVMTKALLECDLAVCDCCLVNEDLQTLMPSFFDQHRSKRGLVSNFYRSSFMGCCMAFHRRVLEKAIPFPEQIPMHDQWIGLIAQKYFKVKFIPQVLVDHRRHSKNYSTTGGRSKFSLGKKVISRFKLAKMLLQR